MGLSQFAGLALTARIFVVGVLQLIGLQPDQVKRPRQGDPPRR